MKAAVEGPTGPEDLKPQRPSRAWSWGIDAAYLVAAPFLVPLVLLASRGFMRLKYRRGLLKKFGAVPRREGGEPSLWLHAVSVGEVLAARPLIEALAEKLPGWSFDLSASTYTGHELACRFQPPERLFYFPLDVSWAVRRTLDRRRPEAVVLVELEVWPNFLVECARRGIPVFVVNGRMTERSCRRYETFRPLLGRFFRLLTGCGVQNEEYAARFRRAGVPPERIAVLGNIKYDRKPEATPEDGAELRKRLGWPEGETVLIVAGSTHPGEEAALLSVFSRLRREFPAARLVLAPRHGDRLNDRELGSWGSDHPLRRWSRWQGEALGEDVLVVDTMGELERFYAGSDIAYVGGSLVPRGGHNVLEPARLGKPVLFGPHYENFAEEAGRLLRAGGARCVRDERELESALGEFLRVERARRETGASARKVAEALGGATRRYAEWIARTLERGLVPATGR